MSLGCCGERFLHRHGKSGEAAALRRHGNLWVCIFFLEFPLLSPLTNSPLLNAHRNDRETVLTLLKVELCISAHAPASLELV